MTSKKYFVLALTVQLFIVGCAGKTRYVDPQRGSLVVSLGKINIQDFANAAQSLTQSLIKQVIAQGRLQRPAPNKPAILAISRIVNNTAQHVDMDLLIKKIRVELNRTGEVLTTTTMAYGGAEDPLAEQTQQYREFTGETQGAPLPDYTLTAKIIEDYARENRTRQTSYTFQMSLTNKDGLAIWEDEVVIVKAGTKSAISW